MNVEALEALGSPPMPGTGASTGAASAPSAHRHGTGAGDDFGAVLAAPLTTLAPAPGPPAQSSDQPGRREGTAPHVAADTATPGATGATGAGAGSALGPGTASAGGSGTAPAGSGAPAGTGEPAPGGTPPAGTARAGTGSAGSGDPPGSATGTGAPARPPTPAPSSPTDPGAGFGAPVGTPAGRTPERAAADPGAIDGGPAAARGASAPADVGSPMPPGAPVTSDHGHAAPARDSGVVPTLRTAPAEQSSGITAPASDVAASAPHPGGGNPPDPPAGGTSAGSPQAPAGSGTGRTAVAAAGDGHGGATAEPAPVAATGTGTLLADRPGDVRSSHGAARGQETAAPTGLAAPAGVAVAPAGSGAGPAGVAAGWTGSPGQSAGGSVTPGQQLVRVLVPLRSGPDGVHQLTVGLQPEGLGTVRATVVVADGALTVRLSTADAAARQALQHAMDDLRRHLGDGQRPATVVLAGGDGGTRREPGGASATPRHRHGSRATAPSTTQVPARGGSWPPRAAAPGRQLIDLHL